MDKYVQLFTLKNQPQIIPINCYSTAFLQAFLVEKAFHFVPFPLRSSNQSYKLLSFFDSLKRVIGFIFAPKS